MLYSGDEIGQVNDYTYKDDPDKAPDSRYIHRGAFHWELTRKIGESGTVQQVIFSALSRLEQARAEEPAFDAGAAFRPLETGDDGVLGLERRWKNADPRIFQLQRRGQAGLFGTGYPVGQSADGRRTGGRKPPGKSWVLLAEAFAAGREAIKETAGTAVCLAASRQTAFVLSGNIQVLLTIPDS